MKRHRQGAAPSSVHQRDSLPPPSARAECLTRRRWLSASAALCTAVWNGCVPRKADASRVELVWGRFGGARGEFQKPRAIAIDDEDRLYIVDMTARIQVFDRNGTYIRGWRTPEYANGKPSGLSFDREGNLLVADTHYFRVLVYRSTGELLADRTIGGVSGNGPGQFNFVTDAVQDTQGNVIISEYGNADRLQKFDRHGKFLFEWGIHGDGPLQYNRPNNLALDAEDRVWIADACNHRIQVVDARGSEPRLVAMWGTAGRDLGQLSYPYDLVLGRDGYVYIAEFGNHRVQKFTRDGKWVAAIGGPGREPGQFAQPWALAEDSQGALHVLDSYNHRVQRLRLEGE